MDSMREPDRSQLVAELVERYALADRFGAVTRARQLLASGIDDSILAEVVVDAQRQVGALWQADAWTVSQEHAATAIAEAVLATLDDARPPAPARGRVAMVAADGEWHVLPARLAARAFEQAGVHVRFLGGSVPPDDLVRTLPTTDVDALAISVTQSRHLPGAARSIAAAHAAGLPVVIGGQAVDAARAEALGADLHAERPADAAAGVLSWVEHGPPVPLARARLRAAPAALLRAARAQLTSAALERLREISADTGAPEGAATHRAATDGAPTDGGVADVAVADGAGAQAAEALDAHLAHLEAAVLLDDASVYAEALAWMAAVREAREADGAAPLELDALEAVLADHPAALALLRAARA
jgi:methanogenic corrinoid protein MtbC1